MTTPQLTRIVAAVLDTKELVLYKENGQTIVIPQGDPRVRKILAVATPLLTERGYADVDLTNEAEQTFKEFEEKSSGVVRLFRIAKQKLKNFFEGPTLPAAFSVGEIPTPAPVPGPEKTKEEAMVDAVNEILEHATPVARDDYHERDLDKQASITEEDGRTPNAHTPETADDTIIAVVDGKIIPGMEKIKSQFARAARLGSTTGVENFLRRLGSVIGERKHSVEDLLKFMERADLPIAEDGSIVIYKVLKFKDKENSTYVDCHTQKVTQRVGSYVCMDASLVDHNRNNECSNGLHVARRGYIGSFSGDVCVMAKLAPEDVIAVPQYDANKMRVCAYHIIFELTEEQYRVLRTNQPITNSEAGKILLGRALAGDHTGITEEVKITGQKGTGLVITPMKKMTNQEPSALHPEIEEAIVKVVSKPKMAEALQDAAAEALDEKIDPKAVVQEVKAQLSRKEQAKKLYDALTDHPAGSDEQLKALDKLHAFKKAAKVGWDKLGLPDINGGTISARPKTPVKEAKKVKTEPEANPQPEKKTAMKTPREQIACLLPLFQAATGAAKKDFAKDILKIKQGAKKSWDVLGVPSGEVSKIKLLTD